MKMKRIVALLLLLLMFLPTAALAATPDIDAELPDTVVQARWEEISYYYRVIDGRLQFRIWSVTYGYWLTDWAWA